MLTKLAVQRIAADPQTTGNSRDMPVFSFDHAEQSLPFGYAQWIVNRLVVTCGQ